MVVRFVYKGEKHLNSKLNGIEERERDKVSLVSENKGERRIRTKILTGYILNFKL
jgi:hypothetical protein